MSEGALRILTVGNMYPPHHQGGYEVVWHATNRHLRAVGHDVRVLVTGHRQDGVAEADEPDVFRELDWYWRDHGWPRRSLRERLAIERGNAAVLARHCAEHGPDAIAWWSMGGLSVSLLSHAHRAGIPSVAAILDDWLLYAPQEDQWHRAASRPGLRPLAALLAGSAPSTDGALVDAWLFLSDWTRRKARGGPFGDLPDAEVAHPGIDAALFAEHPPQAWGWRLLYAGRVEERKGVADAVQALAQLPAEATLTVDGHGDERHRAELQALAERLGVSGRVRFPAPSARHELPAVYAAADAVVFPSRWDEPWGLVPIEAMAVGRPVVATARGGSAEYLCDGGNALVVAHDDPAAVARAVRRLAGDADLRGRLRAQGLRTAAHHTDDAYHRTVEAALRRVSAGGRGSRAGRPGTLG